MFFPTEKKSFLNRLASIWGGYFPHIAVTICFILWLLYMMSAVSWAYSAEMSVGIPINEMKCEDYLKSCRASCGLRGGMYKFICLGENFVNRTRYNCICSDDLGEQL